MTGGETRRFGRYLTGKILGTGGMGMVYEAYDPDLERTVALKIIHNALADNQKSQSRFNREAKLVAKLEHPNIVPIYDYGVEENSYYIVMRLLSGGSLEGRLRSANLTLPQTAALFEKLASALQYAHTEGLVHRDIKMSNVLYDQHDTVYLADFGLAKLVGSPAGPTATGQVPGTPSYMAPELWRNQEAGPASDIYALGVLAYRVLSGHFPFDSNSPYALMLAHMFNKPAPLSQVAPAIPEAVDGVVARALEKMPENRYASATAFSQALQQVAAESAISRIFVPTVQLSESRPVEAETIAVVKDAPTIRPASPLPALPEAETDVQFRRMKWGVWAVIFVAMLVMVLISFMFITANLPPSEDEPTPTSETVQAVSAVTDEAAAVPSVTTAPTVEATEEPDIPTVTMTTNLSATTQPSGATAPVDQGREITDDYAGSLTADARSHSYTFEWLDGQLFKLCARSSEFDITLQVVSPDGDRHEVDDMPGVTDACIEEYVPPIDGTYTVTVGSYQDRGIGSFTLSVTAYAECQTDLPVAHVIQRTPINIRESPSLNGRIVGQAMPDHCFAVIGRSTGGDWWKIRAAGGLEGWVRDDLVEILGSNEGLPVLES